MLQLIIIIIGSSYSIIMHVGQNLTLGQFLLYNFNHLTLKHSVEIVA